MVEAGGVASRHADVSDAVWAQARGVLPQARTLAGTFPDGSGANCFATVLEASGEAVADDWVQADAFEGWLASRTTPVVGPASDDQPGTVLVWHEAGVLAHAAVTLGGGWALAKASQAWCSPRAVTTVSRLVHGWTFPGTKLTRHRLCRVD